MYTNEKQSILFALGDVYHLLRECDAILAGGAITSLFTRKEINDYDIYFHSEEGFSHFMREIYNINTDAMSDMRDCRVANYTDRSILTKVSGDVDVQLIVYKFFEKGYIDIFNSFDFTVNMGAFHFKEEEFVFHPDFLKHNAQRMLSFNHNTDYPLISSLRVQKYVKRGYTISKAEMLKVLFACVKKDYKDWETVKDEVGSMYGLNPDEVFDVSVPFSIEAVIQQLDKDFDKKRFLPAKPTDFDDLYRAFKDKFDQGTQEYIVEYQEKYGSFYWMRSGSFDCSDFRIVG